MENSNSSLKNESVSTPSLTPITYTSRSSLKNESVSTPSLTQITYTSRTFEDFKLAFCLMVLILGVTGNFVVIIIFGRRLKQLKVYEILLMNLAIADFIGTLCLPLQILLHLESVNLSVLGNSGCMIITWLAMTSLTVSAFTLVAIAVDRLMIVTRPLRAVVRGWKVAVTIASLWLSSSTLGIVSFLRVKYDWSVNNCRIKYANQNEDHAHTLLLFIFQVALPLCILTAIYSVILRKLKPGEKLVRNLSANYEQMMKVRNKKNKKAVRLFLTIVIMFYILVLPFHIFYLYFTFHIHYKGRKFTKALQDMYHVLLLLYLSNSCVNPIIYSRLHKSCRNGFIRLICMCCQKQIAKHQWARNLTFDMIGSIEELRDVSNSIMLTPLGTPTLKQRRHSELSRSDSSRISSSPQTSREWRRSSSKRSRSDSSPMSGSPRTYREWRRSSSKRSRSESSPMSGSPRTYREWRRSSSKGSVFKESPISTPDRLRQTPERGRAFSSPEEGTLLKQTTARHVST